jgi:molecular chaperone GrpE
MGEEEIVAIDATGTEALPSEKMQEELEDLKDQNLRLQAEFDNYRKRQAREFHRLCSQGKRDLIGDMLSILDDLDRAREHFREGMSADETVAGMFQIASKLEGILGREGLEAIPLQPMDGFDPNIHEAVVAEEREGIRQDVVLEVLRKGYMLEQDLLRPALVKVGRPVPGSITPGE